MLVVRRDERRTIIVLLMLVVTTKDRQNYIKHNPKAGCCIIAYQLSVLHAAQEVKAGIDQSVSSRCLFVDHEIVLGA